jgi:hypothetical protein
MVATPGLRQAYQDLPEAEGQRLPIDGGRFHQSCADGWLSCVRQHFMSEVLQPC